MGLRRANIAMAAIADYERRQAAEYKHRDYVQEQANESINGMLTAAIVTANDRSNRSKFLVEARSWLLEECIYRIYNNVLDVCLDESANVYITDAIKRGTVHQFISEAGGAPALLRRFYDQNILLSEMYQCVEHYYELIAEATKKDSNMCKDTDGNYKIPSDIQDRFYEELDTADFGDVSMQISTRVIDAIDKFVSDNSETMNNIRDILQTTKDKVAATKQTIKSSNEAAVIEKVAEKEIVRLKQNHKMNIFSYMIESTAKNIMKDSTLREGFLNKAQLDIDKIKAYTTVSYAMLETANTLGIITVDDEYLSKFIDKL